MGDAIRARSAAVAPRKKTVVLAIARDLRRELLAGNRYRVLLSRTTDAYVPLRERVARAQAARADLFLSLHADAHGDRDVRGASVYTLSEEAHGSRGRRARGPRESRRRPRFRA
jgi:N-acetylmuramoyl-L-alanine amidase